jgi:hypothetical protein
MAFTAGSRCRPLPVLDNLDLRGTLLSIFHMGNCYSTRGSPLNQVSCDLRCGTLVCIFTIVFLNGMCAMVRRPDAYP